MSRLDVLVQEAKIQQIYKAREVKDIGG